MTAVPAPPPAARPLNLIDLIVDAGRLYGAHVWTVLGVSLMLQGSKVVAEFLLRAAFGGVGLDLVSVFAMFVLIVNGGVCARLAIDVRAGNPPDGPIELLRRVRPRIKGLLWLATLYAFALNLFGGLFMSALYVAGVRHINFDLAIAPGFLVVVFWLIAAAAQADDAKLSAREALYMAWELIRQALVWVVAFVVFQWFVLRLIPALADSIIGRHAPLDQWWPVEGLVSAIISPLLALTTGLFYLALRDRFGAEAMEQVRPPLPPAPVFLQPASTAFPAASLPPAATTWLPGYDATILRLRKTPAVIDAKVIKRLRWAMVIYGFGPMLMWFVIMGLTVSVTENPDVVACAAFVAFAPVFLGLAGLVHRELLPMLRDIQSRAEHGVPVQVVISRVASYRPRFAPFGSKIQLVRFYGPGGHVVESYSQVRLPKLVAGHVVTARYDPAYPTWVALDNPRLAVAIEKTPKTVRGMVIGAVGVAGFGVLQLLLA